MAESWEASRVIGNVARAVDRARQAGVPVIWVQHESDDLPRDSASWQLVPELVPAAGEKRVYKRFPSSFEETDLEQSLAQGGTTHIFLAGAQTNWCIRATAYAALDRGYDLTLLKDAHTTAGIELGNGSRVEAPSMVADLNVAMKWLSYPGRKNATTSTEEAVFRAAGGET
jgi:nicotinamidase-related amidase